LRIALQDDQDRPPHQEVQPILLVSRRTLSTPKISQAMGDTTL
jgi:hypothetical protein